MSCSSPDIVNARANVPTTGSFARGVCARLNDYMTSCRLLCVRRWREDLHVFAVHRTGDAHVPGAPGQRSDPSENGRMSGKGVPGGEQDGDHVRHGQRTAARSGNAG